MNCDAVRGRLLNAERPDRPSDDVRRHLAVCPACRVWGRRLARAEQLIPFLAVPPSSAKDAFVRRFAPHPQPLSPQGRGASCSSLAPGGRGVGGEGAPVVRRVPLPWPTPPKERGLRKLSLAVAIAAVLAVFTLGLWSWPLPPAAHTAPAPAWVVEFRHSKEQILALPTPRERVERLTDLAAALQEKARAMTRAGDAEDLTRLAALYGEVVETDLLEHAGGLSAEERPTVLKAVALRLGSAESEFTRLATADPGAATARPLQELAVAARDGGRRIQALLRSA